MGRGGVYNAIGVSLASTGVGVPVMIRVRTAEGRMIGRITFANHLEATKLEIERLTVSGACEGGCFNGRAETVGRAALTK